MTSFIRMLELLDGSDKTIADAVVKLCEDFELDTMHRLCGLGTDGASVILGRKSGS